MLTGEGCRAAVISMPCWELFSARSVDYREQVLGKAPRIGVEAACGFGWEKWLGADGIFIGMSSFGASAPIADLYTHFGITSDSVVKAAKSLIDKD
jgi:transketolase